MTRLSALFIVLLIIPMTALARMATLTQEDLGEVTGQVGITVDLTWQMEDSFLAWTDDDGYGTTLGLTNSQGVLRLDNLAIDDGDDTSPGPISIVGIKLDAGTTSNGTTYLCLSLPSISGEITIGNIVIGSQIDTGGSRGAIYLGDFNLASSTLKVMAH